MPNPPIGKSKTHYAATFSLVVIIVLALVACVFGIYSLVEGATSAGLGFLLFGVGGGLLGLLLYCQTLMLQKFVSYSYRAYEALLASAELQRQQEEHLRTVSENSNLSEWAKRIVYRKKDYEFLRDSINEAVVRQDWESAEHLIEDVETEFGYRDEAQKLRQQLEQARKATTEEKIAAVLERFDRLCDEQKWQQAHDDCERLKALFPDNPRIAALPKEIESRRAEYKQKLLKEYDQAVKTDDIERAHRLLFALDQYIAPSEAEALKDSARSVFRARLEQIKTRFSIAVQYKQYHNAVAAGEQLMREFPNSGYAQEISKLMPVMRERARKQRGTVAPSPTRAASH